VIALLVLRGSVLPKLGLGVAAMLAVASFLPLIGRKLRRTPLSTWGMVVAHFGVAVAIAGMAASTMMTVEVLTAARPGDQVKVGPWLVEFESITPSAGSNWTALEAELHASRGSGVTVLKPQARFYTDPPTQTTESAIETVLSGQLYTVLGQAAGDGRWQLRLWWKPLITLIWLGGAIIALGGALSLGGRTWRAWRKERQR
jgi:cytochrome c-type biogenesis protein CcmF